MTFWQVLEEFWSGPAAVTAEWCFLLQGPIEPYLGYLRPRQDLASGFPRIQAGRMVAPYCVVQHGPDEFEGYEEEGLADNISLTRKDLVVYELNRPKLIRELAVALGISFNRISPKQGRWS